MKHFLGILVMLIMIYTFGCKEASPDKSDNNIKLIDDYSQRIDSLIKVKEPHFFSGVVLVTKGDSIMYKKEHGYSDYNSKKPISLKDKFRIWSNSKQITAVLVLKEVENGTIDLRKPIKNYLPNLRRSWADSVTVHHLLNMSSGVMDVERPLAFNVGTGFYYSNPAYGLLGRIIENVHGKTFVEVANSLFNELGMENTYAYEFGQIDSSLVTGHWIFENDVRVATFEEYNYTKESWEEMLPGGGMVSTAYDLNIWDKKLHNSGILDTETYELMITSDVIDNTEIDKNLKYGYGVNINEKKPIKYIGHRGRGMGFTNIKIYVPEKNLDIIVLENVYHDNEDPNVVYHFSTKIRDIILSSNLVQ